MTVAPESTYPLWLKHKLNWGSREVPLTLPDLQAIFSVLNCLQFDSLTLPTCLERNQLGIVRTVFCLTTDIFCIYSDCNPIIAGTRKKCYKSVLIDLNEKTAYAVALLIFQKNSLSEHSIQAWRSVAPLIKRYIRVYRIEVMPALNRNILIQELFDGDAFEHAINKLGYRLNLCERFKVCYHVARQLKKLHSRGLAHRDIKPENILIKKQAESVKAALIDYEYIYTNEQIPFKGTPSFISPEMVFGLYKFDFVGNENCRFEADIWALGLVFHELIYNRPIWTKNLTPEIDAFYKYMKIGPTADNQSKINRSFLAVLEIMQHERIEIDSDPIGRLIESMTAFDFKERPNITTVCSKLYRLIMDRSTHTPRCDSDASTPQQSEYGRQADT